MTGTTPESRAVDDVPPDVAHHSAAAAVLDAGTETLIDVVPSAPAPVTVSGFPTPAPPATEALDVSTT